MDNNKIDEGLQGNEKIETAIAALQQEASEEMLAHTLTVIRRRMKEGGQFIIAVEPPTGGNQMQIFRAVLAAEEAKGIIVNPWNRTIMLDKNLIRIILGEPA